MNDLIKTTEIKPNEVFVPNGLDFILKEIVDTVKPFVSDISTEKGRKEIASICYKIKRSKTYLDNMGKEYVAELKKQPKIVDAERKRVREFLENLEEETRKPLTEWEQAEEKRKDGIMERINNINPFLLGHVISVGDYSTDELKAMAEKASLFKIDDSLQEFKEFGKQTRDDVILKLSGLIATQMKQEAEQAELERLRKEATEREQKEREERLKREAAESARREAELKAAQEKAESERKAKEEAERMEREKQAAIAAQEAAERRAKEAEERANREAEEAVKREQARVEAAKKAEEEAAKKREADKKHFAAINNKAVKALMSEAKISEVDAKTVITAIAKQQIPNVSISY